MSILLPELHVSGKWKLKTPYNHLLSENIWYTCVAIRKYEELIAKGINPYQEYYQKDYSIPESKYQEDLKAGGCIITVKAGNGSLYHFPSPYLESFPKAGGVPYQALALAIDLGALPEKEDLTLFLRAIEEVVTQHIGVDTQAKLVNLAPKELIERESHLRLEQARQAKKQAFAPQLKKIQDLQTENQTLRRKLADAERWIIAKSKQP